MPASLTNSILVHTFSSVMRKLLIFDPSIRSSSSLSLSALCLFDDFHTDFGSAVMVVIVVWKFPG